MPRFEKKGLDWNFEAYDDDGDLYTELGTVLLQEDSNGNKEVSITINTFATPEDFSAWVNALVDFHNQHIAGLIARTNTPE